MTTPFLSLRRVWLARLTKAVVEGGQVCVHFNCEGFLLYMQVRSVTAEVRNSITVSNLQQMSILTELAAIS